MKDIKFRAWSNSTNTWVDKFLVNSKGNIDTFVKYHPVELNQYTGIKDVNGKEIYEGDFVSTIDGIFEFVWDDLQLKFSLKLSDDIYYPYYHTKYEYVIVGNKYQNNLAGLLL